MKKKKLHGVNYTEKLKAKALHLLCIHRSRSGCQEAGLGFGKESAGLEKKKRGGQVEVGKSTYRKALGSVVWKLA